MQEEPDHEMEEVEIEAEVVLVQDWTSPCLCAMQEPSSSAGPAAEGRMTEWVQRGQNLQAGAALPARKVCLHLC